MELLMRAEAHYSWKASWDDYLVLVNPSPSTFRLLVISPGGDTSSLRPALAAPEPASCSALILKSVLQGESRK